MFEAVLIDRDGVINEEVDCLHRVEDLALIEGSAEAVRRLNEASIPAIVVTNQPVVARGLITEDGLAEIHAALEEMLSREGAHLDGIYYCPFHENANLPKYRQESHDRKPNPGMLLRAAAERNLDLRRCVMIGDRTVDILAGQRAGCKTLLVETGAAGTDKKHEVVADYVFPNLLECVKFIVCPPRR